MNVDAVKDYVLGITSKYSHVETSELGYRTEFELLLKSLFATVNVTRFDNDAKASRGNKPDFVVRKGEVPILYIETKDVGISLDKVEKSEQMARYFGYDNLILTDYLEFRFYRNGLPYGSPIHIGTHDTKTRNITPLPNNYENLARTIVEFPQSHREPIKSGSHLAKIMGGKAQRIRDNVRFLMEESKTKDAELEKLFEAVRDLLVKDLTPHSFADMYAQTLVYGLFVARYYDKSKDNFTRSEARELIPNSNKFLKRFFDHIVGVDFKSSLKYLVDELCEVFAHADVSKLMEDYYKTSNENTKVYDPVIHFYEDFLREYDPELKKKMGAYYTPQPVVDFIVKSVDQILKKEFGLVNGLADTEKLPNGLHKVQILDPATGTGTFISTIIREIYVRFKKTGQEGRWPAYVHNDLLPRIHGFELMMAPYTIAHLRLGIAFAKTGFWNFHRRLGIYLTNSLDNDQRRQLPMAFGLAESIAEESKEASVIKNETPIMVVVGNPPYSGVSSNETEYANSLVERYKVEPGGKQKLQERKHWLNDDYVKFIALAESMIEKAGDGIMAMITNNGYLDNPTFRGMRWQLAKTFDKIYILDLHGNVNRKEKTRDGGKDENVFDIMQGVGIILAVKSKKGDKVNLAEVYHADLHGSRENKFEGLNKIPDWEKILLDQEMYYFIPKNNTGIETYKAGFAVDDLFNINVTGVVTARDQVVVDTSLSQLKSRIEKFYNPMYEDDYIRDWLFASKKQGKYQRGDSRGWKLEVARKSKSSERINENIQNINYRPFDDRYIFYVPDMIDWGRFNIMSNFINHGNLGLIVPRQAITDNYSHVSVTRFMADNRVHYSNKGIPVEIPLYIYQPDGSKAPNLNMELVNKIEGLIGKVTPEKLLFYVYAILHSPEYRAKYIEFLKTNFPRVPYPNNIKKFNRLVDLGKDLVELHLLESPKVNNFITTYPISGSDTVEKVEYINGAVYINESQYFGKVPDVSWTFYMGGYQPAQKWLKDRKGKVLMNEDIEHYQKMIVALKLTSEIMQQIDKVGVLDN